MNRFDFIMDDPNAKECEAINLIFSQLCQEFSSLPPKERLQLSKDLRRLAVLLQVGVYLDGFSDLADLGET